MTPTLREEGLAELHATPATAADAAAGGARTPVVWLILADKLGDNAQARVIADALPWQYQERHVAMRARYVVGKPAVAASLHHLDPARSDRLEPPWPDIVITIGRRLSMVALWIQEQSGGRTRIVLVGPPKGFIERFDLVVVSAQYRLAARDNVLRLRFPLQRVDPAAIAAEARAWESDFASLRRPLIAVMVGGRTKAVRFSGRAGADLARDAAAMAAQSGGSLVVTTSRRTPPEVVSALRAGLPQEAVLHVWTPQGGRNPYRALLALADVFVVTSDSISMLVEVARLGRPLMIYPLPLPFGGLSRAVTRLARAAGRGPLARSIAAAAHRLSAAGRHRDFANLHNLLVESGAAVWFGAKIPPRSPGLPDEVPAVVERIVALLRPASAEARTQSR